MESGLFYELLRVALGTQDRLSRMPTEEEWRKLFAMAEKQAVDGIAYHALERLATQGQKPSEDIVLDWFSYAEQIKEQNRIVNRRCKEVTKLFAEAGYESCILKGQGNANMYPNPMLRVPGDIDIWVKGNRKEIREFVVARCPEAQDGELHIQFPIFDDVPVEVHYKPFFFPAPKYNKRLQKWFDVQTEEQFNHIVSLPSSSEINVCVPTVRFNVVHQMSHMMGHFLEEGIGLRQFVDYYYLLKKVEGLKSKGNGQRSEDYNSLFEYLGMLKFARGVMWIEKELLGLDERYLIAEPSEKIGRLIKKEMEEGGNFGKFDERYNKIRKKGYLIRGLTDIYRLLKLTAVFPSESLWKIYGKALNQRWKIRGIKS